MIASRNKTSEGGMFLRMIIDISSLLEIISVI